MHLIAALGVLISLIIHKAAGILIFGLLTVCCSVLINRIARQSPTVLQGRAGKAYLVCMWAIAACIAVVLIGLSYLAIFTDGH